MQIRRVVTGHDSSGKAVFASDELVDGIRVTLAPGLEIHRLWGGDEPPQYPDRGSALAHTTYFPPVGGFRFIAFATPPESTASVADTGDMEQAMAEVEEKLPGLFGHMEPDSPGFHRTETIDMLYVVSGEIILSLDDGAEVLLKAGDTVVQSGTRHAWRNPGKEPCLVVGVLVGATRGQ